MKRFFALILLSVLVIGVYSQNTLTPELILNKTISNLSNTKGVEAHFSVTNSGYTGKGVIKTSGGKFMVALPEVEVWYNGKDLYTYNKDTGETVVVIPTSEELSESNPLAYVTSASKKYKATYSTVKKTGSYVLELTPLTKGSEIKRITLTVGKTNFMPERIVVEPSAGAPIRSDITSIKNGITFPSSQFEYPKSQYSKIEIIDLR